jgi:preprotein translocase subunit YajC
MDWLPVVWLLAAGDEKAQPQVQSPFADFAPFVPLVAIVLFFYFFVIRNQRREKDSHAAMLAALKKNDKVQTIGGIIGSVANVSADGQEVTLKVDDNTRIKFIRSAIQKVLSAEGEAAKPAETK